MTRYDVTITDGCWIEIHRAVSPTERNRLADFAFRHNLTARITDAASKTRGEGTFR